MRTHKDIYYFERHCDAAKYAIDNNWPTDRIINYGLGWAIQIRVSGPYVGPTNEKRWQHLNRIQKRIMAKPYTTKTEFFAQPESDQIEYYNWIQKQYGSNACFA